MLTGLGMPRTSAERADGFELMTAIVSLQVSFRLSRNVVRIQPKKWKGAMGRTVAFGSAALYCPKSRVQG
jgi:hypothetical protein